jgi:transcription elongation factor
MATLKEEGVAAGERLKEVATRWKALGDAGKAEWNAHAKGAPAAAAAVAAVAPASASASGRRLNGYNLFMREKMAELKAEGVASGDRLKEVATRWKAMGDEGKAEWSAKAKALP